MVRMFLSIGNGNIRRLVIYGQEIDGLENLVKYFPFTCSCEFQHTSLDLADVLERYPLMSQQAIVSPYALHSIDCTLRIEKLDGRHRLPICVLGASFDDMSILTQCSTRFCG